MVHPRENLPIYYVLPQLLCPSDVMSLPCNIVVTSSVYTLTSPHISMNITFCTLIIIVEEAATLHIPFSMVLFVGTILYVFHYILIIIF